MMTDQPESRKDYADNGILFSRVVKAGKRVYYIDVKRDRRDEFYISMTESKTGQRRKRRRTAHLREAQDFPL